MARWLGGLDLFKQAQDMTQDERGPMGVLGSGRTSQRGVISAWQTAGALTSIPWAEMFGADLLPPVSVSEALRVGPIKKGRAILHATLGSRPLRQYSAGSAVPDPDAQQPTWLYRTDTLISPQQRLKAILDDHLFYDSSLLAVLRGAQPTGTTDPTKAPILDAVHVPRDRWELDDRGGIEVDGKPVLPEWVVWLPGPSQGLLVEAADEVREWRKMRENMGKRLANPTPFAILQDTENNLGDDETARMVADFNEARRGTEGGTAYVPSGITAQMVSANDDAQLYVEGRNGLRLDLANHLNMPASLLEGSLSTASLTYSTSEGKRNELADLGLDYWRDPIEASLSLDNVCPRGKRIRLDLSDLFATINAPAGAVTGD